MNKRKFFEQSIEHAKRIKKVCKSFLDPETKVFLFGSVVKRTYTMASDIDVLIFSPRIPEKGIERARIIAEIRKRADVWAPFELHLVNERMFKFYRKMVDKMVEV